MRFDGNDGGGWVPGLSGQDINDDCNSIDDTLDALRRARAIHKKAISAIDVYLVKAKVNRTGTYSVDYPVWCEPGFLDNK